MGREKKKTFSSFAKSNISFSIVTEEVHVVLPKLAYTPSPSSNSLRACCLWGKMFCVSSLVTVKLFFLNHFLWFLPLNFTLCFEVI